MVGLSQAVDGCVVGLSQTVDGCVVVLSGWKPAITSPQYFMSYKSEQE